MIQIVNAGLFSTVQDEGRWGYQAFGMPVAGVMDRYAFRVANILVGNSEDAAVLEMTASGDTLLFEQDSFVAVCGADMQGAVNGVPINNWSSFKVTAGSELSFRFVQSGYRTYLAVHGGIAVPEILGSRSTYTKAALGGLEGRKIRAGDVLKIGSKPLKGAKACILPEKYRPIYSSIITLRVLPGPQDDMFTTDGLATFFNSNYNISNDADRMGYRLEGPKIAHRAQADIVSDALCMGAIQVPGHGMPIILMADRQTTGGYVKIGTVIGPDLWLLAQGKPGDTVAFRQCSDAGAVEALRVERETYKEISAWRDTVQKDNGIGVRHAYKVTVNNQTYAVEIVEE